MAQKFILYFEEKKFILQNFFKIKIKFFGHLIAESPINDFSYSPST